MIHIRILVLFVVLVSMTAILVFMPEDGLYTVPIIANKTIVVAAHDSPEEMKALATHVCDGTADQVEIQRALDALSQTGGTVTLTGGTFYLSDCLNVPGNVVLEGRGSDATRFEWSSGFMLCDNDQIVLRDFTTTGTGAIWLRGISHAKVHNVVATVDASLYGAAFTLWARDCIMEDIEFVNCKAIDCGRHGWMHDGMGSPKLIRNVRYIDCEAINCGRYSRSDHWTTGFDFAENSDIEDIEVIRCYAEGNWESGFHFEGAPSKKRVTIRDCVSKNNGQKPDGYYNDNTATYGCLFGAGFWLHGDVTLINCIAENNRKCGYAVWAPSSYTSLYNCADTGSEIGYRLVETDNVYLENCISTDAGKYGVLAASAGQITTKGLAIVTPKGDGSVSNIFSSVRGSSFDIDTYGGGGTVVSCTNGQDIQFSGTVRSNAARPVVVSGSVDTSRLSVQSYTGGQPSPVTPTPTPTSTPTPTPTLTPTPTPVPSGKPDLVVTEIAWDPAGPVSGDVVTFRATIKNQGTAATPAGVISGVAFLVDDRLVVWSDYYTSAIAPGGWVTVTANGGPSGSAVWKATSGTHTVQAWVDDVNRIAESDETNNVMRKKITIRTRTAPVKGDLNGDGSIDWVDVAIVAEMAQGKITPTADADLNGDGTVNWEDVALLFDFFFGRTSSL